MDNLKIQLRSSHEVIILNSSSLLNVIKATPSANIYKTKKAVQNREKLFPLCGVRAYGQSTCFSFSFSFLGT